MTRVQAAGAGREIGLGTAYWLIFLLALDSGDILRAAINGAAGNWQLEAARILGASFMGGSVTPLLLGLVRRYPVEAGVLWRRVLLHVSSAMGLAFVVITLSCVVAPLAGIGDTRPFWVALPYHLAANWLLLGFIMSGLIGFAHAWRFYVQLKMPTTAPREDTATARYLSEVTAGTRGKFVSIDLASIHWIETQGNYLALHNGTKTHLLRETMAAFEPKLDPDQFVRIHRRILVAAGRVREIKPTANGDGLVCLDDGTELRLSRNYRARLHEKVRISRHRPGPSRELVAQERRDCI